MALRLLLLPLAIGASDVVGGKVVATNEAALSRAPSGLLYKQVKPPPPDAARPRAGDTVTCDYTTWRGGFGARLVESSAAAGRPPVPAPSIRIFFSFKF